MPCRVSFLSTWPVTATTTYGEFMLALSLGASSSWSFGVRLNLPLVSLLSRRDREPGEALGQVIFLKACC